LRLQFLPALSGEREEFALLTSKFLADLLQDIELRPAPAALQDVVDERFALLGPGLI
jgi:hypothetical protein